MFQAKTGTVIFSDANPGPDRGEVNAKTYNVILK